LVLSGFSGFIQIENQKTVRDPGDLLLLGPGIPHCGVLTKFPMTFITVYFLPWILIEMGPESDGVRILQRFTTQQPAEHRVVKLPLKLRPEFRRYFEELHEEFLQKGFGREVRLRSLLMEMLVKLVRWEQSLGHNIGGVEFETDWQPILKALKFLRENYGEPIYSQDLARAAGLGEARLKQAFQRAFGISWLKFLQAYRVHRAAALMTDGTHNVTEAALAVGFDSLSHFNVVFRSFMGRPPKNYARPDQQGLQTNAFKKRK
jgi:AraC-like DNA-binding protein